MVSDFFLVACVLGSRKFQSIRFLLFSLNRKKFKSFHHQQENFITETQLKKFSSSFYLRFHDSKDLRRKISSDLSFGKEKFEESFQVKFSFGVDKFIIGEGLWKKFSLLIWVCFALTMKHRLCNIKKVKNQQKFFKIKF